MRKTISEDDTAVLVVGSAENDPSKIVFRIDNSDGEQLAYVRLTKDRALRIADHIRETVQLENCIVAVSTVQPVSPQPGWHHGITHALEALRKLRRK